MKKITAEKYWNLEGIEGGISQAFIHVEDFYNPSVFPNFIEIWDVIRFKNEEGKIGIITSKNEPIWASPNEIIYYRS